MKFYMIDFMIFDFIKISKKYRNKKKKIFSENKKRIQKILKWKFVKKI